MPSLLHIVTPCFNDAPSLHRLMADLDRMARDNDLTLRLVVVDDGSVPAVAIDGDALAGWPGIRDVDVLRLTANAGHQRAIAVGLSELAGRPDIGLVVVMDCDGEDRADDVPRLLADYRAGGCAAVVARRAKRSEGLLFRLGYVAFKAFYTLLTGRGISFGNFMLLDAATLCTLIDRDELWHSLPGTLLRARVSHRPLATERGHRYSGLSHMNFTNLILHGLASISVFGDIALVRALMFTFTLTTLAGLGAAVVIGIRLFTPYAIPGWASSVVLALAIIGLQGLLSTMSLVFILLNGQRGAGPVPRLAAKAMIGARHHYAAEHELS